MVTITDKNELQITFDNNCTSPLSDLAFFRKSLNDLLYDYCTRAGHDGDTFDPFLVRNVTEMLSAMELDADQMEVCGKMEPGSFKNVFQN